MLSVGAPLTIVQIFPTPTAIGNINSSYPFVAGKGKRTTTPTVSRPDPAHN